MRISYKIRTVMILASLTGGEASAYSLSDYLQSWYNYFMRPALNADSYHVTEDGSVELRAGIQDDSVELKIKAASGSSDTTASQLQLIHKIEDQKAGFALSPQKTPAPEKIAQEKPAAKTEISLKYQLKNTTEGDQERIRVKGYGWYEWADAVDNIELSEHIDGFGNLRHLIFSVPAKELKYFWPGKIKETRSGKSRGLWPDTVKGSTDPDYLSDIAVLKGEVLESFLTRKESLLADGSKSDWIRHAYSLYLTMHAIESAGFDSVMQTTQNRLFRFWHYGDVIAGSRWSAFSKFLKSASAGKEFAGLKAVSESCVAAAENILNNATGDKPVNIKKLVNEAADNEYDRGSGYLDVNQMSELRLRTAEKMLQLLFVRNALSDGVNVGILDQIYSLAWNSLGNISLSGVFSGEKTWQTFLKNVPLEKKAFYVADYVSSPWLSNLSRISGIIAKIPEDTIYQKIERSDFYTTLMSLLGKQKPKQDLSAKYDSGYYVTETQDLNRDKKLFDKKFRSVLSQFKEENSEVENEVSEPFIGKSLKWVADDVDYWAGPEYNAQKFARFFSAHVDENGSFVDGDTESKESLNHLVTLIENLYQERVGSPLANFLYIEMRDDVKSYDDLVYFAEEFSMLFQEKHQDLCFEISYLVSGWVEEKWHSVNSRLTSEVHQYTKPDFDIQILLSIYAHHRNFQESSDSDRPGLYKEQNEIRSFYEMTTVPFVLQMMMQNSDES